MNYLILSGQDFRSKRQVNMHFIARELVKRGATRFFSLGFSQLSRLTKDPRLSLWERSNRVEIEDGVEAFLWRTPLHPFHLRLKMLDRIAAACFAAYAQSAPQILRDWVKGSDVIIIESGMGIIFHDLIREINPSARLIYLCSDALATIGCAPYIRKTLARVSASLDGICIPSKLLRDEFPQGTKLFYVPHGIDPALYATDTPSPYRTGVNLVSVGSMLFDPDFFRKAAKAFPDFTFHVIGGGAQAASLSASNLIVHGEMAFADTIAYMKHADAGIAPYSLEVAPYLADTSMKLMQFEHLGIPAVCPHSAAVNHASRFGYAPGDGDSIAESIKAALRHGRFEGKNFLSWDEVTSRILNPQSFPDTHVG